MACFRYQNFDEDEKQKLIEDTHAVVSIRGKEHTNFVEFRQYKIVYRRYAGLFFCLCVDVNDNDLASNPSGLCIGERYKKSRYAEATVRCHSPFLLETTFFTRTALSYCSAYLDLYADMFLPTLLLMDRLTWRPSTILSRF